MSTKIYNGYIFQTKDFFKLNTQLQKLAEKIKDLKTKHACKKSAKTFADYVDSLTVFGREISGFEEFSGDTFYDFLSHLEEMAKKAYNSKYRMDSEWDLSCSVTLHPISSGQILGLLFEQGSVPEYKKTFEKQTYVRDYHYQNSTDKPKNITTYNWRNRKKHWDEVFPSNKSSAPINRGPTFTLASDEFPFFEVYSAKNKVFDLLPSLEDRKKKCFKEFVEHQYFQSPEGKELFESQRWMEMFRKSKEFFETNQESYKEIFEQNYADKFVDLETLKKDGLKALKKGHLIKV